MYSRSVIPTGKGFSTFFGYYGLRSRLFKCSSLLWIDPSHVCRRFFYVGGAEDYYTHQSQKARDMHNDTGSDLKIPANDGVYSTFIYARQAKNIIDKFALDHAAQDDETKLFMYLAFQAIHSPDEVPDSYRDQFNNTIPDTPDGVGQHRRIVAGMINCLDDAIGNVTAALKAANMFDDTIIVFTTGTCPSCQTKLGVHCHSVG